MTIIPAFFPGQLLTAADLDAIATATSEGRWRHNRDLHGWGIAAGLGVASHGGASVVRVESGHALDAHGREIVVPDDVDIEVPPVAGRAPHGSGFALTVSWADDGDLPAEHRNGVCGTGGPVRIAERARLRWQDPAVVNPGIRLRPGFDIVLATGDVRDCVLVREVDTTVRTLVRGRAEPYLYAGRTSPGATDWSLWPDVAAPLGVVASVDTTAARFPTTPLYMPRLVGDRYVVNPYGTIVVDGPVHVGTATPESFDFVVVLASGPAESAYNPAAILSDSQFVGMLRNKLEWSVAWLGAVT